MRESIKHLFSTSTAMKFLKRGFEVKFENQMNENVWAEVKNRLVSLDYTKSLESLLSNFLPVRNSKIKAQIKQTRVHLLLNLIGEDKDILAFLRLFMDRILL